MDLNLKPGHEILLWKLLLTGEEPMLSKARPSVSSKDLAPLIKAGIIVLEQRGRAKYITLTDKAWVWAGSTSPQSMNRSTSRESAAVLHTLIERLVDYIQHHEVPLIELVGSSEAHQLTISQVPGNEICQQIVKAYDILSSGERNVRVRLSDLRRQLQIIPREQLDPILLQMELDQMVSIMPIDDPADRKPEDEVAAIEIAGLKKHIVYLRG